MAQAVIKPDRETGAAIKISNRKRQFVRTVFFTHF